MQDKKDLLIQEYEEQIRQLRQKKLELEQKVSLLEWQLENMKQKLELQEIRHRREISTLNEKVSTCSFSLQIIFLSKVFRITNDNKPLLGRIIIKGSHKSKSSLIDIPWHVDTGSKKCLGQATIGGFGENN